MEKVLTELQWQICLVYLVYVIVCSKDMGTHLVRLSKCFKKVRKAGLTLKPEKCHFLREQEDYLGHVVSGKGIAIDSGNQ